MVVLANKASAETMHAVTEPLAPVHFEKDGEIQGIATEIVRAIFAEAGLPVEFQIYPWNRAYQMALNSDNTFVYTINRTPQRESLFKWIGPILGKEVRFYKLRNRDDIEINSFADIKKYTTAVILGHSLIEKFLDQGFREGKELITTANKRVQMKVFLKGRADLITGNQFTILAALQSEGYTMDDIEPAYFISSGGYYLGANREVSDAIVEKLNRANDKIQHSGVVEKIIAKYM